MAADDPGPHSPVPEGLDAFDDVLSTLGNDTRLRILLELAAVASRDGLGTGLSFSELRDRVGVADSGRFNYHLDQLQERFVTKEDDQYLARYPGLAIIAALYAGEYDDLGDEPQTSPAAFTCPECSTQAEIHYAQQLLYSGITIQCPEHGAFDSYPVPPGAKHGRSLDELAELAYVQSSRQLALARQGVCTECWGTVATTFPVEVHSDTTAETADSEDGVAAELADRFIWVEADCQRCWNRVYTTLRDLLLTHPSAAAFFQERGYEPFEASLRVTGKVGPDLCESALITTDPPEAVVRYQDDTSGNHVELTVDKDLAVVDISR